MKTPSSGAKEHLNDERSGKRNETSLTPGMTRLGRTPPSSSSSSASNKDKIRSMIKDCLNKEMYSSAIFFAERLSRTNNAAISDHIQLAKCFQHANEHRRCLATLQQKGLLEVSVIGPLSNILRPPNFSRQALSQSQSAQGEADFLTPVHLQHLSAVYLAGNCLYRLEEYEDCLTLLESLVHVDENVMEEVALRALSLFSLQEMEIHMVSALYCLVGKCYDSMDHRARSLRAFSTSLRIDPACTEAVEYMSQRGMLSQKEKRALLQRVVSLETHPAKEWLGPYYSFMLSEESPECLDYICLSNGVPDVSTEVSANSLVLQAEYLYECGQMEECFRVAGQAYLIDPYNWRGNLVYIGSMVNLSLKNELFYIGHELVHSHPKHAVSWYAVGCYYWTCQKLDLAQKYLQKCTKLDKRLAHGWVLLGSVLAAQEESEHAISAYRTACRVSPGVLHPQISMAKELVRTSNYSLALHVLAEANAHSPANPTILNEMGVIYLQLNRNQDALKLFRKATERITQSANGRGIGSKTGVVEILSNYATCLRKCGILEESIVWYRRCLSFRPNDPMTHANIGFTLHLSRRFDEAVDQYHRALSLQPAFSFCSDMLTQALTDMTAFPAMKTPIAEVVQGSSQALDGIFLPQKNETVFDGNNMNRSQSMVSQFSAIPSQGGFEDSMENSRRMASPMTIMSSQSFHEMDRSRLSFGDEVSWDEDSVASYSRVAGRLSLSSAYSNRS